MIKLDNNELSVKAATFIANTQWHNLTYMGIGFNPQGDNKHE